MTPSFREQVQAALSPVEMMKISEEAWKADHMVFARALSDLVLARIDALLASDTAEPSARTCGNCAKHRLREDPTGTGERYSFCDVLGQLPDELPDGYGCNQWAAPHTERTE